MLIPTKWQNKKGHNFHKINTIFFQKLIRWIYSPAPVSSARFKAQAQIAQIFIKIHAHKKSMTNGQVDGQMTDPKAICPSNIKKIGGIIITIR